MKEAIVCMRNTEEQKLHDEEALEALTAVFPEIQIRKNSMVKLSVDLKPHKPVKFALVNDKDKVRSEFESYHVGCFEMEFTLPLRWNSFGLYSSTVSAEALHKLSRQVRNLIKEAHDQGFEDSAALTVCNFLAIEVPADMERELLEDYYLRTSDDMMFQRWTRMCEKNRLKHFSESRFLCSICLENKYGCNGVLMDCDHALCKSCFKEYTTTTIDSGDVTKLQCPECPIEIIKHIEDLPSEELKTLLFNRKMSSNLLRQVVGNDYVKKYEALLTDILFDTYEQHYPRLCFNCPRCRSWGFRDDRDEKLNICRRCLFAYCIQCEHSWHGYNNDCGKQLGMIPPEVIASMLDDDFPEGQKETYVARYGKAEMKHALNREVAERQFFEAVENDDSLVPCPRCRTVITKSDGCNKMTCSVCHTNFCYLCGDALNTIDPYTHFSVPKTRCYRRLFEGLIDIE